MLWHGIDWHVYHGTGRLNQAFAAENVRINRRGNLVLKANQHSGGVSMIAHPGQTHGRWSVRFRVSAGRGAKYAILLWPDQGLRPEIDFAEGWKSDPDRTYTTATVHPSMDSSQVTQARTGPVDLTRWHRLGVRYRSWGFAFWMDGHRWARIALQTPARLHLAIQCVRFDRGPRVRLEVSDVRIRR